MSIYSKTLQAWRGTLATALISGGLVTALYAPALAQPVLAPVSGVKTPITSLVTISGHVPDLVYQSKALGALPTNQTTSFAVSLPVRDPAGLADLIKGQTDPADARFGQYLTPQQFGERFGATQAQYNAVIAYLESKGLTISQTWPSRTYLNATGTVAQVNSALGVTLKQFVSPEGRTFHAPDAEVKVPASIASLIAGVVDLDNANPPKPLAHMVRFLGTSPKSFKAITPMDAATPDVQNPGEQGTGLGGGYAPTDIRTVYGLNSTALTGTGQVGAIIEYGTTWNIKDTLKYENLFNLPRVPITIVPVDGGTTTFAADGAAETNLDIDMQLSMAPGLSGIRMYLDSGASTLNPINAVATDNIAKQLSISYGFANESTTRTTPSATQVALETAYAQCAAEGISVYVSTGDSGSAPGTGNTTDVINTSSDEPMVCAVGGTALTVQQPGSNENYLAESAWNYNGTASGGADGGGVSRQWTIQPHTVVGTTTTTTYDGATYQANAATSASTATFTTASGTVLPSNVSATMRNVPDISCDASPETGVVIYVSGDPGLGTNGYFIFGGTSESAPLWAGYTALINQNRLLEGMSTLGLPQMSLYPLAYNSSGLTSNYTALFHDINDGSNNNTSVTAGVALFTAVTGFDDSTGLGTMRGAALIAALSNGTLYEAMPGPGRGMASAQSARANSILASYELPRTSPRKPAGL